eukprot:scaffold3939_cov173-Skeletonema_dohrnii-CCMP3373.AAC.1
MTWLGQSSPLRGHNLAWGAGRKKSTTIGVLTRTLLELLFGGITDGQNFEAYFSVLDCTS